MHADRRGIVSRLRCAPQRHDVLVAHVRPQPVDVGQRVLRPARDDRQVLTRDGVHVLHAEVEMPVEERQAVLAAPAQREHRPEQDRAVAAEHERLLPGPHQVAQPFRQLARVGRNPRSGSRTSRSTAAPPRAPRPARRDARPDRTPGARRRAAAHPARPPGAADAARGWRARPGRSTLCGKVGPVARSVDHDHRHAGVVHDPVRDAAEQRRGHPPAPARAHHDHVGSRRGRSRSSSRAGSPSSSCVVTDKSSGTPSAASRSAFSSSFCSAS